MAQLIGIVRSTSEVARWGNFLSFNLDNVLTVVSHKGNPTSKIWWKRHQMIVLRLAEATMHQLLETLMIDDLWSRPVALYLPRDPTHVILSDASYIGIRGGAQI